RKRRKLLQCHRAEWAAWIIKKPKQQSINSRARKGSAVFVFALAHQIDGQVCDHVLKIGMRKAASAKAATRVVKDEEQLYLVRKSADTERRATKGFRHH